MTDPDTFFISQDLPKDGEFYIDHPSTQLVDECHIDIDVPPCFGVIVSCCCFSVIHSSPSSHSKAKNHVIYRNYAFHTSGRLYRT